MLKGLKRSEKEKGSTQQFYPFIFLFPFQKDLGGEIAPLPCISSESSEAWKAKHSVMAMADGTKKVGRGQARKHLFNFWPQNGPRY